MVEFNKFFINGIIVILIMKYWYLGVYLVYFFKSRIGYIFNVKRKIIMFGFDEISFYFVEKGILKIVFKDCFLYCW